jgi:hypothetical protein
MIEIVIIMIIILIVAQAVLLYLADRRLTRDVNEMWQSLFELTSTYRISGRAIKDAEEVLWDSEIQQLGLAYHVESEFGKGSCFWFEIPFMPTDQEPARRIDGPVQPPSVTG